MGPNKYWATKVKSEDFFNKNYVQQFVLVQRADIIHVHKEKRWAIDFVPGSWGAAESKWHLKWVLTMLNNKGSKMSKVWSFEITQCVIGNEENYSIWRKEGFEKKSAFVKVAWSQYIKNSVCHMDLPPKKEVAESYPFPRTRNCFLSLMKVFVF